VVLFSVIVGALFGAAINGFDVGRWRWWLLAGGVVTAAVWAIVEAAGNRAGTLDDPVEAPAAGLEAAVPWVVPILEPETIARPELVDQVVALLTEPTTGTVGVTTTRGLHGAGGFGKTTVAVQVCHRPEVRRRFPGGLVWVTVGQERHGEQLAALVNDVCEHLTGARPGFSEPEQAGYRLRQIMGDRRPTLLVVDDVWTLDQLRPFLVGPGGTTVLVTTRILNVLPDSAHVVDVDKMAAGQSRRLLGIGLDGLPDVAVGRLLALAGGWPLLLALINGALRRAVRDGQEVAVAAAALAQRLEEEGPAVLDVHQKRLRQQAVGSTVQASLALLPERDAQRYRELAVFPEDTDIPAEVLQRLWHRTGGLTPLQVDELRADLVAQALVSAAPGSGLRLHDVLRNYLRRDAEEAVAETNRRLLEAYRQALPASGDPAQRSAWWLLPETAGYMWRNLCYHLAEAGGSARAELGALVQDLRWVDRKSSLVDVAAVEADLGRSDEPIAAALRRALAAQGHLLGPITPEHSHADVLISRLAGRPELTETVERFAELRAERGRGQTRVVNRWPLPDTYPALRRTYAGSGSPATAVAISPDGSWLAVAHEDGTVRIRDAATGAVRRTLTGHVAVVSAVAIAPDGTWLATVGWDQTVRIWEAESGVLRATLTGHSSAVTAVAIAPDGTWLATGGWDYTVRVWDVREGREQRVLEGHRHYVTGVAISPDGRWLASASWDNFVRTWDPVTGAQTAALAGHTQPVTAVAISPDGRSLATASFDGTARVWDVASGVTRRILAGHTETVCAVAFAPDGSWVATGAWDDTARIWETESGRMRSVLTGHRRYVTGVAVAPDGSWFATASWDQTVRAWDPSVELPGIAALEHMTAVAVAPDGRWLAGAGYDGLAQIWDVAAGLPRATLAGHVRALTSVVISPDGQWLATGSYDDTARTWRAATGVLDAVLTGHQRAVTGLAISPDGTWLASSSNDRTARLWEVPGGAARAILAGHTDHVTAVAIAPDGTWLATAGRDGVVRLWDAATGRSRLVLRTTPVVALTAIAIAPDGDWLAAAGGDGVTRVWDASSGAARAVLTGHSGEIGGLAIAPDGSWLATAGRDGTARTWDVATGAVRAVLRGHSRAVTAVAIHADGFRLATVGNDGTIRVWDGRSGANLASMRVDGELLAVAWLPLAEQLPLAGQLPLAAQLPIVSPGAGLCAGGLKGTYLFDVVFDGVSVGAPRDMRNSAVIGPLVT
jgi:WD40 repeat protein